MKAQAWAGFVQPRRLHAVWLLSLLLHAVVIVAWLNQRRPAANAPVPRIAVPAAPLASANVQPPRSETVGETQGLRRPARVRSLPAPITLPKGPSAAPNNPFDESPARITADPTAPRDAAQSVPSAPSAPTAAAAPLRLDWTPPSRSAHAASAPTVREQALNDSRSNIAPLAPQARLAQNLGGDGRLHEEALGDGSRRFRKGTACVDVHTTHIARLNPFDERLRDTRVAKACD